MNATLLGCAGLTIKVRCVCGYRNYLDRAAHLTRGFSVCDNCGSLLCQNDFSVVRTRKGRVTMEDLVFVLTPERAELLAELDELEARVVRLAASQQKSETCHRIRNIAQAIAAQKSLLVQDWHFADLSPPC